MLGFMAAYHFENVYLSFFGIGPNFITMNGSIVVRALSQTLLFGTLFLLPVSILISFLFSRCFPALDSKPIFIIVIFVLTVLAIILASDGELKQWQNSVFFLTVCFTYLFAGPAILQKQRNKQSFWRNYEATVAGEDGSAGYGWLRQRLGGLCFDTLLVMLIITLLSQQIGYWVAHSQKGFVVKEDFSAALIRVYDDQFVWKEFNHERQLWGSILIENPASTSLNRYWRIDIDRFQNHFGPFLSPSIIREIAETSNLPTEMPMSKLGN